MRKILATVGLLTLLAQPAMAQNAVSGSVRTDAPYQNSGLSGAREVFLLPVRVVSGAVGAPVGAIGGMAKRTGQAVQVVNDATFKKVVDDNEEIMDQPGKQFGRGVLLVPVGIVGTAAAVPIGAAVGAVEGTFKGLAKGFTWPSEW